MNSIKADQAPFQDLKERVELFGGEVKTEGRFFLRPMTPPKIQEVSIGFLNSKTKP